MECNKELVVGGCRLDWCHGRDALSQSVRVRVCGVGTDSRCTLQLLLILLLLPITTASVRDYGTVSVLQPHDTIQYIVVVVGWV